MLWTNCSLEFLLPEDGVKRIIVNYSLQINQIIPQATIIHHIDTRGAVWATHKRHILRLANNEWQPVAELPASRPRDFFSLTRITSRMARADKCNVYVNRLGNILAIRAGSVYAIENGQPHWLFSIQGDSVLHRSICEDEDGNFYFGEYFMNPDRRPVHVWQVAPDLNGWQPAAELNGTRHVHGVYRDPFHPEQFWVTAGDFDGECRILRTNDRFNSFQTYGDGGQNWRAVNLFFTPDHVTWLTDSNLERNHAWRMRRQNGRLEMGQAVDAPVWYGCTTIEGLHVAFTTVEQGAAVLSHESEVLISEDAFQWQRIFAFKKDFWKPVKVFKYGVISCSSGAVSQKALYLSGEGLVGLDGICARVAIQKGPY